MLRLVFFFFSMFSLAWCRSRFVNCYMLTMRDTNGSMSPMNFCFSRENVMRRSPWTSYRNHYLIQFYQKITFNSCNPTGYLRTSWSVWTSYMSGYWGHQEQWNWRNQDPFPDLWTLLWYQEVSGPRTAWTQSRTFCCRRNQDNRIHMVSLMWKSLFLGI